MNSFWEEEKALPARVVINGVELTKGVRVRLHPRPGADVMDIILKDKIAIVEAVERDFEDNIHVAVTIEDDPGRDLGEERQPGHRFFYSLNEIELVDKP